MSGREVRSNLIAESPDIIGHGHIHQLRSPGLRYSLRSDTRLQGNRVVRRSERGFPRHSRGHRPPGSTPATREWSRAPKRVAGVEDGAAGEPPGVLSHSPSSANCPGIVATVSYPLGVSHLAYLDLLEIKPPAPLPRPPQDAHRLQPWNSDGCDRLNNPRREPVVEVSRIRGSERINPSRPAYIQQERRRLRRRHRS